MAEETDLDLEPGDFLYQADQEIFLVVMEEQDDSYLLAAHGWRNIGKDRLDDYIQNEQRSKLYGQDEVDEIVGEEADDRAAANYTRLRGLFQQYAEDFDDTGPHVDFAIDDKE